MSLDKMEREVDCRRKNEAEELYAPQGSKEEGESDRGEAKERYSHPLEELVEGVRTETPKGQ